MVGQRQPGKSPRLGRQLGDSGDALVKRSSHACVATVVAGQRHHAGCDS
jgi:hypothetical protein